MVEYREYKESGQQWLGKVPSHWVVDKISAHFQERKTIVSDVDFAPLSVTKNGVVPQLDTAAKSDNGENRKLVKNGDFVVNSRSDRKGSCGFSELDGSVSVIYIVATPIDVNGKFYHYLFRSNNYVEEFYRNGHGIVADLWTTRYDEMKNIQIPIPPKEEQEAIVAYLDKVTADIDKAIAAKERIIASLEERRKIIITHAVTRGINPDAPLKDSGIDWLGQIPAHWEIIKLGALGSTQNGVSNDSTYFGKGYPFVSYSDVYKNSALPSTVAGLANSTPTEQKNYSVQSGDVFFTRTSETAEEIGFSSVCLETIPTAVFAGFLIRFRPKHSILNPLFSKYYFRASVHRNYFVKEMNLVIRASLSQKLLRGLPILIPPLNEQTQISEYLEDKVSKLDNLIKITNKEIELLRERKNIIINETVTGKVKVI